MKPLLLLAGVFLVLQLRAQTAQEDQINQWEQVVQSNANDSIRFMTCIDLHNAYFVSNLGKAKKYALLMLEIAKKSQDDKNLAKAYTALARCETKNRNYKLVIPYNIKILNLAIKSGKESSILSAYMNLAINYLDADQPAKGLTYLTIGNKMSQQLHDSSQMAKVIQTYGDYYRQTNQHTKAIVYYDSAAAAYAKLQNEKMMAACRIFSVQSLLSLGKTDRIPTLLFDALEYYTKINSPGRQAFCYGLLGQSYLKNGFEQKGLENYLRAKQLFRSSNNFSEEASATIDIANYFLSKKNYPQFEKYARDADSISFQYDNKSNIISLKTLWAQYYSEKGNYKTAEKYFYDADKMAIENAMPDLKGENEKQWATHLYKQKKYKSADSLLYSYAQRLVASRDAATSLNELKTIISKNRNIDSGSAKLLSILYTPGGVEVLKKRFQNESFFKNSGMEGIAQLNPFSLAPSSYDSSMRIAYNAQLVGLETQFRTRQIADSLTIEKQQASLIRNDLKNRNIVLLATGMIVLLLATGLWLQFRSRKRAELDKSKIELLQNEIHHRVKNNLGVISRLVDVAGKNAVDAVPLSVLKHRIKAIELLHKHLYSQEAKPGNISLQAYLEDLCLAIAATFETGKDIRIKVDAREELPNHVVEKLGLIINELVTNSYKYAFEGKSSGIIDIHTEKNYAKKLQLIVEDNGVGFNSDKTKSNYGIKLIKGLSNELNGTFSLISSEGTKFTLEMQA